jgi:hypothetical protein
MLFSIVDLRREAQHVHSRLDVDDAWHDTHWLHRLGLAEDRRRRRLAPAPFPVVVMTSTISLTLAFSPLASSTIRVKPGSGGAGRSSEPAWHLLRRSLRRR